MASHEVAVWSVLVSLLIASAGCWIANLARIFRGQSLLTFAPRRHVPWGLIDLAIALVIMFAAQSAALQLLKSVWHVDFSMAPKEIGRAHV